MTAMAVVAATYAPAHHALAPQELPAPETSRLTPARVHHLRRSCRCRRPHRHREHRRRQHRRKRLRPHRTSARDPCGVRKRGPLGDPTPLVCTVAKAALEIALGADGINHLARWITPTLRTTLLRQQSLSRRAGYAARGEVSVARVRLCRVSATAVETAVVATEGEVAHALAMRLEAVSGRWLVTALDVG